MASRSDWLLVALNAANGKAISPVQVQKTMFVFKKGASLLPDGETYDFEPYDYGPFDSSIYNDLADLAGDGLVEIVNPGSRAQRRYVLTPAGEQRAAETLTERPGHSDFMKRVVGWVQAQSFTQLVRAIYERWPEFKVNSVFRDNAAS